MNRRQLAVAGMLAFAIGLIVLLPARVATAWIQGPGDGISLSGIHGTWLNGQARQVRFGTSVLKNVHWQWQPAALFSGRIALTLHAATDLGGIRATAAQTFRGTTALTNLHGRASVGWLAQHIGYTFVPISGQLTFDMDRVALNDQLTPIAASGQLYLARVYWQLTQPPLQLGRYAATISTHDGQIRLQMAGRDGPLAVRGHVTVSTASRQYTLRARLRPRAGAEQRLRSLLGMLGEADASGAYRIQMQGQL